PLETVRFLSRSSLDLDIDMVSLHPEQKHSRRLEERTSDEQLTHSKPSGNFVALAALIGNNLSLFFCVSPAADISSTTDAGQRWETLAFLRGDIKRTHSASRRVPGDASDKTHLSGEKTEYPV
ncbi:MAG: uncharacterized protein A8A55_3338, partial [Amphiamblys sp. WSBS2006]